MIPVSDMQQLLSHLDAESQSLTEELYVLDANVLAAPETNYALSRWDGSGTEASYVLRALGQVQNFSEKAAALQTRMQAAACLRWDLTSDENGRFARVGAAKFCFQPPPQLHRSRAATVVIFCT
jgi:hypothetical protein